jgi:LuxR family quorum-sensing system transcriptional regulator SolR
MKPWQEDQLQAICSVKCDNQFFQKILEFSKELGFDYCAYGMRIPLPLSYPKTFLFNNYPKEWQMQYQRKNYLAIDPSVRVATRSLLPVIWTDDLFNSTPELWEEARSFGLRFGLAQSIRDFNGSISMLTLARSEEPITAPELNAKRFKIAWLTQTAHIGMSKYLLPGIMPEVSAKLSTREREVLQWTAVGKTSSEISRILNIAERTVNFHINNVMTKLNAPNKTSAATKAAVLGLL